MVVTSGAFTLDFTCFSSGFKNAVCVFHAANATNWLAGFARCTCHRISDRHYTFVVDP